MTLWHSKSENPKHADWYITARLDLPSRSVPRYFDDTEPVGKNWFIARDNGGSDGLWDEEDEDPLVVNMSFDMWCEMPRLQKGRQG